MATTYCFIFAPLLMIRLLEQVGQSSAGEVWIRQLHEIPQDAYLLAQLFHAKRQIHKEAAHRAASHAVKWPLQFADLDFFWLQMDAQQLNADRVNSIYSFFDFYPVKALPIIAATLFGLAGLAVLFQTVRSRAWFMLIVSIVALLEVGGFICRIEMLTHPLRGVYILMQCLLIIPPSFLALVSQAATMQMFCGAREGLHQSRAAELLHPF